MEKAHANTAFHVGALPGANSGLGYETSVAPLLKQGAYLVKPCHFFPLFAEALLRAGGSVIFACRNEKKATPVILSWKSASKCHSAAPEKFKSE